MASPATVAMAITGHKTREVFRRYDITSETDVRDAMGKLGRYLTHKARPKCAAERAR